MNMTRDNKNIYIDTPPTVIFPLKNNLKWDTRIGPLTPRVVSVLLLTSGYLCNPQNPVIIINFNNRLFTIDGKSFIDWGSTVLPSLTKIRSLLKELLPDYEYARVGYFHNGIPVKLQDLWVDKIDTDN